MRSLINVRLPSRKNPWSHQLVSQSPIVGAVAHLAASAMPPLGQNIDTKVSFDSQATGPSPFTDRIRLDAAAFSPSGPAGPAGPMAPAGPAGPIAPTSPLSPFGP